MLLEEFDRETRAIIDPDMCAERIEDFPEVTISCFSWKLFDSVLAAFDAKKGKAVCVVSFIGRRTDMCCAV